MKFVQTHVKKKINNSFVKEIMIESDSRDAYILFVDS